MKLIKIEKRQRLCNIEKLQLRTFSSSQIDECTVHNTTTKQNHSSFNKKVWEPIIEKPNQSDSLALWMMQHQSCTKIWRGNHKNGKRNLAQRVLFGYVSLPLLPCTQQQRRKLGS